MKKINLLFIVSFLSLSFFVGCSDDDSSNGETPDNADTITDFVANDGEFSMLNEAIVRVGLNTSLDGTDNFTLFAPNNTAFENYLVAQEYSSISQMPLDVLTNLILNHLITGSVPASDLSGYRNSLSEVEDYKLSLYATNGNSVRVNGNASVVTSDINRSNGTIHVVDETIDFLTINDMVQIGADFTLFAEALEAASDEAINFNELLSSEGPQTVFVPTNQAFQDLFVALGVSGISEIPQIIIKDIVNHHIIREDNFQDSDFTQDQILKSRIGEEIIVSVGDEIELFDAAGNSTGIINANIQNVNGVIHEIDRVLWSQFVLETIDPTITRWVQINPDFSILETALELTGLDAVLSDRDNNYTLLAPNNTAFNAFLEGEDIDDMPLDFVSNLLRNHLLVGSVNSSDLSNGYVNTQATYNGTENLLSMYVDVANGVQFNGMASVSQADVDLANGVIHVVDGVLTLPTLATFVTVDPNLTHLETALTRDDQPDYIGALSTEMDTGDTPFTLWAPGDAAFDNLLIEIGLNDISEINAATLTGALNTHVVAQQNIRSTDLENGPLITLGDEITVDADAGTLTDLNDRVATILEVNLQASNGVMHTIDTALLPQ